MSYQYASTKIAKVQDYDYENVNVYYGKEGEAWIEKLWAQYWPNVPLDYGYAPKGPPPNDQGNHSYPEIYWVGEMAACGCKGDEGPECRCPNTPYCKNNGDDFLKFLDAVEAEYGIKQAMIYEWQYVPTAWLTEEGDTEEFGAVEKVGPWGMLKALWAKFLSCFSRQT